VDRKLGVLKLSHVLTAGAVFPFDFGFVPGTHGADGDALDVLVLSDAPLFPLCLVQARLIGVIEAEQTQEGNCERRKENVRGPGGKRECFRSEKPAADVGEDTQTTVAV
jgi:inorganic pyrophosphatase